MNAETTYTAVLVEADPVQISLANRARVFKFFDVAPETWLEWHNTDGAPIHWKGQGRGRRGYIPVREARAYVRRKALTA